LPKGKGPRRGDENLKRVNDRPPDRSLKRCRTGVPQSLYTVTHLYPGLRRTSELSINGQLGRDPSSPGQRVLLYGMFGKLPKVTGKVRLVNEFHHVGGIRAARRLPGAGTAQQAWIALCGLRSAS